MQRVETLSLLFVPPAEGGGMEITMTYLAILQRFHLYSTYKGCYFNDKRSIFISSNEWRNTYESISYRKIYSIKEKKEKIKREIKENNEIQDICNNGTLDDLLRKFNKISILALCLVIAGCQMSNEPIITTNVWEGHYKDETSFYKATRDIQLKKGESIWVLSNRTLSQLLINERKERK